jgi:SAM-dependent methyltransferase
VALVKGLPTQSVPLCYCELGCGQGFSANLLAAANPDSRFFATDFNPAQIAGARKLAADAGLPNVRFFDHAFAEFADEPALPAEFDIISLHGIYSWISAENRAAIVDFIRRRLKVGGLLYISYNTLPGWAAAMPLRRLMVDHAALSAGPITPRVDAAISFVERLRDTQGNYFAQNPTVGPRLEKLKGMSRSYLAHEYFNRDWTPFYFADVAAELAEAKLTFVGSAHLLDHVDAINLSDDQQKLLAETGDPVRREGLRDFMVNQQFRRDVFVKGAVAHTGFSSREAWLDARFALSAPREDIPLKVTGARGEAALQADVYEPILDALAATGEGGRPGAVALRQVLRDSPKVAELGLARIQQALVVLVGAGHVQPCPADTADDAKRRESADRFNRAVIGRARDSSDLQYLASPVTGGGIVVDRFEQIFLWALMQNEPDAPAFAWRLLEMQGQRLVKDGKTLDTAEENLAELRGRHAAFEKRLPVLRSLGIAPSAAAAPANEAPVMDRELKIDWNQFLEGR